METRETILKRRSIRRFTDQRIPQEILESILKAGFNAPSAHRLHPLDYIIITDKDRLNGLADLLTYGRPLREANCAICVVGDHDKQELFDFLSQDAAASMQNIGLDGDGSGLCIRLDRCIAVLSQHRRCRKLLGASKEFQVSQCFSFGVCCDE